MKMSKHECNLNTCFLCRFCLKEWLPAVGANRKTFLVKKGEEIFKEGDQVGGVYFVYDGAVKVHKKWGEEKELILRIATKGAILGHRGLGSSNIYPVSGTALEPSTVCFIELDFFSTSLKVNHDFAYQLILFLADELQESENNMRNLAHMPVKGRVAKALITLSEKFGLNEEGCIDMPLSRQDLAYYTGTTYETLFRIMNELAEEGCVSVSGRNIALKDTAKLHALANGIG
jgi:CRP-like cAMP-binding protein